MVPDKPSVISVPCKCMNVTVGSAGHPTSEFDAPMALSGIKIKTHMKPDLSLQASKQLCIYDVGMNSLYVTTCRVETDNKKCDWSA